jgi:hypothetical protein
MLGRHTEQNLLVNWVNQTTETNTRFEGIVVLLTSTSERTMDPIFAVEILACAAFELKDERTQPTVLVLRFLQEA